MNPKRLYLVITAHPDDLELLIGGSVAKWIDQGHRVISVVVTSGDKGTKDPDISPFELAQTREKEALEAAAFLGIEKVIFLRKPDGEVADTRSLPFELTSLIRALKPHILVTHDPWQPYDFHPDHQAVGRRVVEAIVASRDHLFLPGLEHAGLPRHRPEWLYLINWRNPDYYEDISEYLEKKLQAFSCHRSQVEQFQNPLDFLRNWAKELGQKAGVAAAEGFVRLRAS